jgi:hypothetical protein
MFDHCAIEQITDSAYGLTSVMGQLQSALYALFDRYELAADDPCATEGIELLLLAAGSWTENLMLAVSHEQINAPQDYPNRQFPGLSGDRWTADDGSVWMTERTLGGVAYISPALYAPGCSAVHPDAFQGILMRPATAEEWGAAIDNPYPDCAYPGEGGRVWLDREGEHWTTLPGGQVTMGHVRESAAQADLKYGPMHAVRDIVPNTSGA